MQWNTPLSSAPLWNGEISNLDEKTIVAKKIAAYARSGDVIGIGSGSTAFLALQELAKRVVSENLNVTCIPTSYEIEMNCATLGLPVSTLRAARPDWLFDGADEIDPRGNMIKGRGGALLREKMVMSSASNIFILADRSKIVQKLGGIFAIPVEVHPDAILIAEERILGLHPTQITLRMAKGKDGPIITEHGNLLLDVKFNEIDDDMEQRIKMIPGVIETGLFMGFSPTIVTPDSGELTRN